MIRYSPSSLGQGLAEITINAYVHENHVVFAQLKGDDKSNEITAIPSLLEMLQLKKATVTIDAMGYQKDIAQKIVERRGQYVPALKGNQSALHDDVQVLMDDRIASGVTRQGDYYETVEKSHGRIEIRKCWTCWQVDWLTQCRVRVANAAQNLARIRRISLLRLKQERTCKLGIQSKRTKAAYDRDYLLTLLGFRRDNDTAAT